MQPPEPVNGPPQPPPAAPSMAAPHSGLPVDADQPPVLSRKLGNRRLRLWLAMGAGVLALLCVGGVGIFISLYDGATEIKRSEPDAVVDGYLRAYLVNRDDQEASLFGCGSDAELAPLAALRTETVKREEGFGVKVSVTWGPLTVTGEGDKHRAVSTNLTITGVSNGQTRSQRTESWVFGVVADDGWRVCSAHKTT